MQFYVIEPEVAGGLGPDTIMDCRPHPPVVTRLQYQFEGWLGDVLLESFPCFIVTDAARKSLQEVGATGVEFDKVSVTTSEQFDDLYPRSKLPEFSWAKVIGRVGRDDLGLAADHRLVISERTLQLLRTLGITNAVVAEYRRRAS